MVNDLFEEQTDLEKIVRKIMQRALTLLQCERCSVLLLEDIDSPVRPFMLLLMNFENLPAVCNEGSLGLFKLYGILCQTLHCCFIQM